MQEPPPTSLSLSTVVLTGYPCNGHPELEECVMHRSEPTAKTYHSPMDHIALERWGYFYHYGRRAMMSTWCDSAEGDDCSCADVTIAGRPYWIRARGDLYAGGHDARKMSVPGFSASSPSGPVIELKFGGSTSDGSD